MLERHNHLDRRGAKALKAVVTIERFGIGIFCIANQGEYGHFGSQRSQGRICKQRPAELLPMKGPINRQVANPHDRHGRVAWKPLEQRLW